MGVYVYYLTTTKRTFMVDGEPKTVHLLKYAYKDSFDGPPKKMLMMEGRLQNIWAGRAAPEYFTTSFEDRSPVFAGWHQGQIFLSDGSFGREYYPDVGYIYGDGKNARLDLGYELIGPGVKTWDAARAVIDGGGEDQRPIVQRKVIGIIDPQNISGDRKRHSGYRCRLVDDLLVPSLTPPSSIWGHRPLGVSEHFTDKYRRAYS